MGIKFTCPACGRALNVKSELAGKKGRCPRCEAKIDIPAESSPWAKPAGGTRQAAAAPTAPASVPAAPSAPVEGGAASPVAAPVQAPGGGLVADAEQTTIYQPQPTAAPVGAVAAADPIAEAPQMQWYVTPPGATSQYGPASGEEFRGWIQEGRVTADSLVWRQDWPDWRPASTVFPQLPSPPAGPAPAAAPVVPPLASMPLPTAAPAMPMPAAPIPAPAMAQPAFPVAAVAPGMFPGAPVAAPAADGFPIAAAAPATTRSSTARGYRQRSNTGPIVAIVVLLLAMIPLSFLVWKVVSEQIVSPAADATAGPKPPEE